MHGNDIRLIAFADGEYKPAVGEILAKDSILYSQKPESRLLRRQLWPIMQETMDTLVDSVSAGANLFKNMLVTNPNPVATKIRNIKNAYISSATSTVPHLKFTKKPTMKKMKIKKVKKSPEPVRTRTVSEDYVHTYNDGYTVPPYVVKSSSKNPYAQMGLKDYKHFEETVLRELEEKEEKKVEAALFKKKPKNIEEELIQGIPFGGWKPVIPNDGKFDDLNSTPNKAKQVGKLHTNIGGFEIKPIHEDVEESRTMHETIIEPPLTSGLNKSRRRKPNSQRSTTTTTSSPPRPFTRKAKDEPNYPEYFLKKHKDANQDNQNTKTIAQEINYMKRMKLYREQSLTAAANSPSSTTRSPSTIRDALLIDSSNEQSVYITPLPKFAEGVKVDDKKMRRLNRQKTSEMKQTEKANIGNRGSIKFGDRL